MALDRRDGGGMRRAKREVGSASGLVVARSESTTAQGLLQG